MQLNHYESTLNMINAWARYMYIKRPGIVCPRDDLLTFDPRASSTKLSLDMTLQGIFVMLVSLCVDNDGYWTQHYLLRFDIKIRTDTFGLGPRLDNKPQIVLIHIYIIKYPNWCFNSSPPGAAHMRPWIGSGNGLSPVRRQAVTELTLTYCQSGPYGTNLSAIWIEIQTFSFIKNASDIIICEMKAICYTRTASSQSHDYFPNAHWACYISNLNNSLKASFDIAKWTSSEFVY